MKVTTIVLSSLYVNSVLVPPGCGVPPLTLTCCTVPCGGTQSHNLAVTPWVTRSGLVGSLWAVEPSLTLSTLWTTGHGRTGVTGAVVPC